MSTEINYFKSQTLINQDTEGDYIFDNELKGNIKLNHYQIATLDRMLKHEEERIITFKSSDKNVSSNILNLKKIIKKYYCLSGVFCEDLRQYYEYYKEYCESDIYYKIPNYADISFRVKSNVGILANTVGSGKTYIMAGLLKNKRLIDDIGKHNDIQRQEYKDTLIETTNFPNDIIGELMQFCYINDNIDVSLETRKVLNENKNNSIQNSFVKTDLISFNNDMSYIIEPRTNLIVVPHSLIAQWKTDLMKLTDYKIKIIKSIKDINFTVDDIIKSNYLHQYDIVLCTSTKMKELMDMTHEIVLWERVIIDEADTIKVKVDKIPNTKFIWFITATQERLIQNKFKGNYRRNKYFVSFIDEILFMSPLKKMFNPSYKDTIFDSEVSYTMKTIINMISIKCDETYIAKYMKLPEPEKTFNIIDIPFIYQFAKVIKPKQGILTSIIQNNPYLIFNDLKIDRYYIQSYFSYINPSYSVNNNRIHIEKFKEIFHNIFTSFETTKVNNYPTHWTTSIFLQTYLVDLLRRVHEGIYYFNINVNSTKTNIQKVMSKKNLHSIGLSGIRDIKNNSSVVNKKLLKEFKLRNIDISYTTNYILRTLYTYLLPQISLAKSLMKKIKETKLCLLCCQKKSDYNPNTFVCENCKMCHQRTHFEHNLILPTSRFNNLTIEEKLQRDIDLLLTHKEYFKLIDYKKFNELFDTLFNKDKLKDFDFNKFNFTKDETHNVFNKMKYFEDILSSAIKEGDRILFFTESSTIEKDAVFIFNKLKLNAEILKGNNNVIRKKIEKFEKGKINVLILNPQYMGSGLNLQMADKLILLNYIDKNTEIQVIGRGNRLNRKGTLKVDYIFYPNEYDLYIKSGNNEKDKKNPQIINKTITEITEEDDV